MYLEVYVFEEGYFPHSPRKGGITKYLIGY